MSTILDKQKNLINLLEKIEGLNNIKDTSGFEKNVSRLADERKQLESEKTKILNNYNQLLREHKYLKSSFDKLKKEELNAKDKTILYNESKLFNSFTDLDITTGASADLKQVDRLARKFIELFGIQCTNNMTKTIQNPETPYLTLSEETKSEIDDYVNSLTSMALEKAINILESNIDSLNTLANDLIEKKTVDLKYLETINVEYF